MPLSLNQKLTYSALPGRVALFRDKVFIHAYNESAYRLIKLYHLKLTPQCYYSKYPPYSLIITVGLPINIFKKQFVNAAKTSFGYQLQGDYQVDEYLDWQQSLLTTLQRNVPL